MANETKETKLGTLYVEEVNRDDCPGYKLGLKRNGKWFTFAWLEVDESGKEPIMKVHAFNDHYDCPVFNINISEDRIKRLYE